jgi:hypothetical protein
VNRTASAWNLFANSNPNVRTMVRARILIQTGDNGGTFLYVFRTETDTNAVTVHAGSFASFRDVTDTIQVKAMDQASTDNTNYADVFTHALEANKEYLIDHAGGYTTSGTGVGLNQRMNGIPSGAAILQRLEDWEDTASIILNLRDGTAINNATSVAGETGFGGLGAVVNGANAGTLAWQFKINDSDTGTVTIKAGDFALLEEVELQV